LLILPTKLTNPSLITPVMNRHAIDLSHMVMNRNWRFT